MSEILQLLNDFQGIIGTILGSVTTLIVTDILIGNCETRGARS